MTYIPPRSGPLRPIPAGRSVEAVAPPNDEVRQLIKRVTAQYPNMGPKGIQAELKRQGRAGISVAVINGVKAGL